MILMPKTMVSLLVASTMLLAAPTEAFATSSTLQAMAVIESPGIEKTSTVVYEEEMPFEISYVEDNTQFADYEKVVQEGKNGLKQITAEVSETLNTETEILQEVILESPIDKIIVIGTKDIQVSLPLQEEDFIAPLKTGYVSQGFRGKSHKGIDIAAPKGTPIYATASGRVEKVMYTSVGYGYYLILDHGNGVRTLYAHNSEMYVEEGDWVDQGDIIAAVGCTGRSTGNHVQYEIRVAGQAIDPEKYI